MKKAVFTSALIALAALGSAQQTVSFARSYHQGDIDNYRLTLNIDMGQQMAIEMEMKQTVKKVYDNGDADIETSTSHMKMNGTEAPERSGGQTTTVRYTKFGNPVNSGDLSSSHMGFMSNPVVLPDRDLKVGETFPVNYVDKKDPKSTVTGTMKVESIDGGVAKVTGDFNITTKQSSTPMKLHTTMFTDASTAKIKSVEGVMTNLPTAGPAIKQVTFKMERLPN